MCSVCALLQSGYVICFVMPQCDVMSSCYGAWEPLDKPCGGAQSMTAPCATTEAASESDPQTLCRFHTISRVGPDAFTLTFSLLLPACTSCSRPLCPPCPALCCCCAGSSECRPRVCWPGRLCGCQLWRLSPGQGGSQVVGLAHTWVGTGRQLHCGQRTGSAQYGVQKQGWRVLLAATA